MAKKVQPGRPRVGVKKKPFSVMLDPEYIEYLKKTAHEGGVEPQEFARRALYAFLPNPNKPKAGTYEVPKVKPPKH